MDASHQALSDLNARIQLESALAEGRRIVALRDGPVAAIAQSVAGPKAHRRFHPFTSDQFHMFPEAEFAVDGVLPTQGIGVIYGAPQSGKSALALSLVFALIQGVPWFDRQTVKRQVWWAALEGQSGLRQRVEALEVNAGVRMQKNAKFIFDALNLMSEEDVAELKSRIRDVGGADVLVIDTLACAMVGGDENSSRDMGRLVASAKELQSVTGGLVLLVHHTGKDASRGMRGHSSLLAALDVAIHVQRHEGHRTWTLTKARDTEDGLEGAFVLDGVELEPDSKGKPRHSIVVTPIEMPEKKSDATRGPAHKNQRAALDAIKLHIVAQSVMNGDAPLEPLPCDKAVEIAKEHMEVGPKHQKLRAQEAIRGLIKQGFLLAEDNGDVRLPEDDQAQVRED